ncbi:MAG: hypothetical protein JW703_05195 [Candidatus Diapherotrites archaeon]|nr:hypothetical protein [Candidatus Diapherotrites archaeon]
MPSERVVFPSEKKFVKVKSKKTVKKKIKELNKIISKKLEKEAEKREKENHLPLPTKKQMIKGEQLSETDLKPIKEQIDFIVKVFGKHLSKGKKIKLKKEIKKHISKQNLTINAVLKENSKKDLKEIYNSGKELYEYIKESGQHQGEIYPALYSETSKKVHFSKGWSKDNQLLGTPVHELIHLLQRMKIIKIDIPFAQAGDMLYRLEKEFIPINKKIKNPNKKEFNKKPKLMKAIKSDGTKITYYYEPVWSYYAGERIGQWIYLKLKKGKRWNYLYYRCMGLTHEKALKKIK